MSPGQAPTPTISSRPRHRRLIWTLAAAITATIAIAALLRFALGGGGGAKEGLARAMALHEAGRHRDAIGVLEKAVGKLGPAGPVSLLRDETAEERRAIRLHRLLALCRREVAAQMREAGDAAGASSLLRAAEQDLQAALQGMAFSARWEIHWEIALCLAAAGDLRSAQAQLYHAESLLETQTPGQRSFGVEDRTEPSRRIVGRSGRGASTELIDRLVPWIVDRDHPFHSLAVGHVLRPSHSAGGGLGNWMASRGDESIPVLVQVIRACSRDGAAPYRGMELIGAARPACTPDVIESALLDLYRDPSETLETRSLALLLFCGAADLPLGLDLSPERPVAEDETLLSKAARYRDEVKGLSRVEGHRRRVGQAIAELKGLDPESREYLRDIGRLSRWLEDRTGFDSGNGRNRGQVIPAWVGWWEAHGEEDPRAWLAAGLGLSDVPEEGDLPDLVDSFLAAPDRQRGRWHHLMCLTAPEGIRVPFWRSSVSPGGNELPMLWYQVSRAIGAGEPYLYRAAGYCFGPGFTNPRIEWQEVRPILPGETVEIRGELPYEADPHARAPFGLFVPGLGVRPLSPGTFVGEQRISTNLLWHRRGLRIGYPSGHRSHGPSPPLGNLLSRPFAADEGIVKMSDPSLRFSRGGLLEIRVTLAILEPPGASRAPWTLSDWRRRFAENTSALVGEVEASQGDLGRYGYLHLVRYWGAIGFLLSGPEAAEALARLDLLTSEVERDGPGSAKDPEAIDHVPPGTLIPARLLAGDARAIDDRIFNGKIEGLGGIFLEYGHGASWDVEGGEQDADAAIERSLWCRLFLESSDPRIRAIALRHLESADLSRAIAAVMHEEIERGGIDAPEWLLSRIGANRFRIRKTVRAVLTVLVPPLLAAVLWLACLALWPGRPPRSRLRPASLLVPLGLVCSSFFVEWDGWDICPASLGYAAAMAGSLILACAASGPGRLLTPIGFGLAFMADGVARAGAPFGALLLYMSVLATALAVAGVPILASALRGAGPGETHARGIPLATLLYAVPAAAWHISLQPLFGMTARPRFLSAGEAGAGLPRAILAVLCILWVFLTLSAATKRRAAAMETAPPR